MLHENSRQEKICGGIGVLELKIEKGVGDNSDKSIVDDTENFDAMIVQQWRILIK